MFLFIIILIAVVALYFLLPSKGKAGEMYVTSYLKRLPDSYVILNDIMLETSYGTTQIDHVVLSVNGLFVIETKNYNGWIFGGANSEYWTQNLYGNKYKFRNPILQNLGHAKALRAILPEYKDIPIIPIVAFTNHSRLFVKTDNHYVLRPRQVNQIILSYSQNYITFNQLEDIAKRLIRINEELAPYRKNHNKETYKNEVRNRTKMRCGTCPRCGGELILRKGKYGSFYGCSNYPKCKFTNNVE